MGAGAAGEDVEDEGGTIDDLDAEGALQITLLGRGEFVVEDGQVVFNAGPQRSYLLELAPADEMGGRRPVQALRDGADDLCPCGPRQLPQFRQRSLERPAVCLSLYRNADQQSLLGLGAGCDRRPLDLCPPRLTYGVLGACLRIGGGLEHLLQATLSCQILGHLPSGDIPTSPAWRDLPRGDRPGL